MSSLINDNLDVADVDKNGHCYVLSLGCNIGDKSKAIAEAIEWLENVIAVEARSSTYVSTECNGGGSIYHNAVVKGLYYGSEEEFDELLKLYELRNGRTPEVRSRGEAPIDIDIVMIDGRVVRTWDFCQSFFQIGFREIESTRSKNEP